MSPTHEIVNVNVCSSDGELQIAFAPVGSRQVRSLFLSESAAQSLAVDLLRQLAQKRGLDPHMAARIAEEVKP